MDILCHVRRQNHQVRAALPGLPNRHSRFDATGFRNIVGRQYDAMAVFLAAADRQWFIP